MANKDTKITEIRNLVEVDIVEFIDYLSGLSFVRCNSYKMLMEVEHDAILNLRQSYLTSLNAVGIGVSDIGERMNRYITTFVIEQRINDRICILERLINNNEIAVMLKSKDSSGTVN